MKSHGSQSFRILTYKEISYIYINTKLKRFKQFICTNLHYEDRIHIKAVTNSIRYILNTSLWINQYASEIILIKFM